MFNFLNKAIDIREGESKRTLIMAAYLFVVIASHNILKPMTRALVVSNLGPEQLPYIYMLLAVVGGIVVVYYLKLSNKFSLDRLINLTSIFLIINLLFFRFFLSLNSNSIPFYYVLYIWSSIYGILTTSQFWLLANYLFNAREAKRLFPFIGASAIMGGIVGGYFARFMVKLIGGTPNLIFFCVGLLAFAIVLMNAAWRLRETSSARKKKVHSSLSAGEQSLRIFGEVVALIKNSRHLAFLIGIVLLTFMVVQIADFQFTTFAFEKTTETDELTGFLAFWISNLSLIALLFQLAFVNTIIRKLGVLATILFLPLALLFSSVWVFFSYTLLSILAVKIGDGAFRHSINKVGTELLYLPIPTEIKKKTKVFIDMFADRFARGLAGFLLLILYTWLGISVAQISLLSIVLISGWLILSFTTYNEYVNSFRQAIAKRRIDAELLTMSIKDEATVNTLIESLASPNERQVVYALKLLESVDSVELLPHLIPLLKHNSSEVRLLTLQLIYHLGNRDLLVKVEPLLHDDDASVRLEAVRYYAKYSEESTLEVLQNWLHHKDHHLRGAALFYLAEKPEYAKELLRPELIQSFINEGAEGRIQVADALGIIQDKSYYPFLKELLNDPDPKVKIRAIKCAGQTGSEEFVPVLIHYLAERDYRKAAREALTEYGDAATPVLSKYLNDENVSQEVRTNIPRVLGTIGSQVSVDVLLDNLSKYDQFLRYQIIKALNKLRAKYSNLKFDNRVEDALSEELKKYFRMQTILYNTEKTNGCLEQKFDLLTQVLKERLDDHLERIFRLLGLRYPSRDIYNAYTATLSSKQSVRANAAEFLDNILANNLKQILLLIVEELPVEQVLKRADGFIDINITNYKDALEYLLTDSDSWLRVCALYEIGRCGLVSEFKSRILEAKSDPETLVNETAEFVLNQFR